MGMFVDIDVVVYLVVVVFFFKQKTAYELRISDWSSDVCSSDLAPKACQAFISMYAARANSRPANTRFNVPTGRRCAMRAPAGAVSTLVATRARDRKSVV